MTRGQPPAVRRGKHLQHARDALINWRSKTVRIHYNPCPFPATAFLPDSVIKTLASAGHLQNVDDMRQHGLDWIFLDTHANDVLAVLRDVDREEMTRRENVNEAAKIKRKETAEAKRQEKKRLEQLDKALEERIRLEFELEDQEVTVKQALTPSAPKKAKRPPLQGTSVLNLRVGATTPLASPAFATALTPMPTPGGNLLNFQVFIFVLRRHCRYSSP